MIRSNYDVQETDDDCTYEKNRQAFGHKEFTSL